MLGYSGVCAQLPPGTLPLQPCPALNSLQERWGSSKMAESAASCRGSRQTRIRQGGDHRQFPSSKYSAPCPCGCRSFQIGQFRCSAVHRESRTSSSSSSSIHVWSSSSDLSGFRHARGVTGEVRGTSNSRGSRRRGSGNFSKQGARRGCCVCRFSNESSVGSVEWLALATPYEVLGVSVNCSEEDIKAGFRMRIKEYHPDVYQGPFDADAITQRLLKAYELLTDNSERVVIKRKSMDPFEEPDGVATNLFVNELDCIGRGCPYSCVDRAPNVFRFAADTGRARVVNQDLASRKIDDYDVQLAVGQCPNNCIHTLTAEQRLRLEEILQSVLQGTMYSSEVMIMDGLIARAKFENGRYQPPKRQPKKTEKWVDWF